jgi:ribosomal protein L11 methyltransferase
VPEAKAHWIEVSLTVNPELAEAVAEVLSRYVANGVVVESDVEYKNSDDVGTPVGPVRVYGYIATGDGAADKQQRIEEALWHLSQIQLLPEPVFRTLVDEDWMSVWKQHYHPINIGQKLLILPAWVEQTDMSRLAVRIDPSMAFGTGTHPSTQLCLQLIEKYVAPGQPLIDVGCGSGILSIAGLKLGSSMALAVDIDPESIRATRENGERNQVLEQMEIGQGSVTEVLNGDFSINSAPLVLANILATVIKGLFVDGLAKLVAPGGHIILAGILEDQAEQVLETARDHGLKFVEKQMINDWVALVLERK